VPDGARLMSDPAAALRFAADSGNSEELEKLLAAAEDPSALVQEDDGDGNTALHLSAAMPPRDSTAAAVRALLRCRASLNGRNMLGETPLALATCSAVNHPGEGSEHLRILELLLKSGADADIPEAMSGQTPLMEAASRGSVEICRMLLQSRANADLESQDGLTAKGFAKAEGHLEVMRVLKDPWAEVKKPEAENAPAQAPGVKPPAPNGAVQGQAVQAQRPSWSPVPKPSGNAPAPFTEVRLLCLLASHISSAERLERFSETLASVALQAPYGPPELVISWSATSPELRDEAKALLATVNFAKVRILEQKEQLSQFQHIRTCLFEATAKSPQGGFWVFFSDDDDLWHPARYSEYLQIVDAAHADAATWAVASRTHAKPSRARASCPEEVDVLLRQGPSTCMLTDAKPYINAGGADPGPAHLAHFPEYFDFALRAERLADFMRWTPAKILANRFCDRRLANQLLSEDYAGRVRWFKPKGWLYFYSRTGGVTEQKAGSYSGGASMSVVVDAQDREVARRELKRSGCQAVMEEGLARLAARLRASVEQQVVCSGSLEMTYVTAADLCVVCDTAVEDASKEFPFPDATLQSVVKDVAEEVCAAMGFYIHCGGGRLG